jgi:hypothetical protein
MLKSIAERARFPLPRRCAHQKLGGKAAFTFSNALRTTRSTYCDMPNQSLRHRGSKKNNKKSLDVFLASLLKDVLLRGVNRVKVKNRQKNQNKS